MELKIKLVRTPQEQKNVLDIRRSVFIDEQQIPIEIEIDAFEESAFMLLPILMKRQLVLLDGEKLVIL